MRRLQPLTWAAFLVAVFVLFARLGELPLIDPDEGRNAEVAREMLASGSWLVPAYDGVPYLDKPAFFFRQVAVSFSLFGTNPAAARLPSAVSALLLLGLVFMILRARAGEKAAALAVLVIASTPLFFAFARTVIFDMPLALFVSGAILAGTLAEEGPAGSSGEKRGQRVPEGAASTVVTVAPAKGRSRLLYLLGAGCAAVATLIKGPVGFLVPAFVLIAFHFTRPRPGFFRRFFAPWNLLLFFALVLPWFFGLAHRRPDFLGYGLLEESLRRYTTRSFHRTAPFYYYVPVLLATCFPWSLLVPEGMYRVLRRLYRRWALKRVPSAEPRDRTAPAGTAFSGLDRLWMVWAVVVVVFFSLSQSKLPGYVLTASVALGACNARIFGAALENRRGGAAAVVLHGTVILAVVAAVLAAVCLQNVLEPGRLQRIFRIRSAEFDRAQPLFLPVALSLFAVFLAAIAARASRRIGVAFTAFLLFPLAMVTACFPGLRRYAQAASSAPLAARVAPQAETVACLEAFSTGLPFYLRHPVFLITRNGGELTSNYLLYMLRRGEPWPSVLVPWEDRETWLEERRDAVYLLSKKGGRSALEAMAARWGADVGQPVPGWWGARIPPPWPPSPAGVGALQGAR